MKKKKFNKKINVFPDNRAFQKHAYTRLFEQFFSQNTKRVSFPLTLQVCISFTLDRDYSHNP